MSRRRKTATAFATGAVVFIASAAAMITQGADARGPSSFIVNLVNMPLTSSLDASGPGSRRSLSRTIHLLSGEDDQPARRHRVRASLAANFSKPQPVCVRLCDGYFFPGAATAGAADVRASQAECSSLCPDAPTEVYYRNGSDNIEDAISSRGDRYSALPVSLRYRATRDNTCTCHRDRLAAMSPLRDMTLRRGDAVMTPAGFLVFKGVEGVAHTVGDFAALGSASLPKDQRNSLLAQERVSVLPAHPSLARWLAAGAATRPVVASRVDIKSKPQETRIRLVEANTHLAD